VLSLLAFAVVAAPLASTAFGQTDSPAVADTFRVDGLVAQPRSFTRDDLAAMSTWSMPVVFAAGQQVQSGTFTGPSLLQVIQAAGGRSRLRPIAQQRLDAQVHRGDRRRRLRGGARLG
jgi:DMSO/TMAO reductase YedYZ molybdopterin-dependent catalytic subunit